MIYRSSELNSGRKGKMMAKKRQSIQRLTAKQVLRTTGHRLITDKLGHGVLGILTKALYSAAIKQTDKINYNKEFNIITKE